MHWIPTFRTRAFAGALAAVSIVTAAQGHAADTDAGREPYRLTFSCAYEADRVNSPITDSLGFTLTHGNRAALGFDFRVLDLPLKGAERPAFHVYGGALSTRRTVAVLGAATHPVAQAPLAELPVVEMNAGFALVLPMSMVTPGAGAEFYAGYQGALVLAGATNQDFLRLKQVVFGFDRTRGLFEGSLAEMAYGRNESWGLDHAAGRWAARFRVQTLLGPAATPPARAVAGKPATPPAHGSPGSPLRAFVELGVDSDAGAGADNITAQVGLLLDAGSVLQRVMGAARQ